MDGVAMACRICFLGFACFLLLFATDQAKIVRGIVKLGVPYKCGLTLAIALRYLPTFFGIFNMVSDAQKARGLETHGKFSAKLKSYMPILIAVLITGLRTSDNISNALETRAFGASVKDRTYFSDIKMGAADAISVVLIVLFAASFVYFFT